VAGWVRHLWRLAVTQGPSGPGRRLGEAYDWCGGRDRSGRGPGAGPRCGWAWPSGRSWRY